MRLGVRGKLFAVSVLLMLPVGLASGLYLERTLRAAFEGRILSEMDVLAGAARDLIEVADPEASIEALDPIADRLAASGARISVIASDGTVLGDSEFPPSLVAKLENHRDRPEVKHALEGVTAPSRRYSTSTQYDTLYVATPFSTREHRGVVRVAKPLAEVNEAIGRLRVLIGFGVLLGIAVAVFMSGLASHLAWRTISDLVESARAIASGAKGRVPVISGDELGRLAGSFNRVVAELERTVAELVAERDHLETILDDMSEGVLALDEKQRIVRANRTASHLLGIRSVEQQPLLEAVRAPALAELVANVERGHQSCEIRLPQNRVVAARAAPLRTSGGCVVVLHDVTEMRRLESVRRDFVANVSHELRTPVAVIRANAETLIGGALADPTHAGAFLDAIHRNAERLTRIIADLLDLSRMEAGQYELHLGAVDVEPVVRRVVESVAESARSKNIEIEVDISPHLKAEADPRALDHVLMNLLDNAVKYTPEGGRIDVRGADEPGAVLIEVADDGPGIEPQHRSRIFERFYRVDPGRSRAVGGTGLGLAIVKHLVGAMGGTAGFRPREPRGSVFWLRVRRAVTGLSLSESTTAP